MASWKEHKLLPRQQLGHQRAADLNLGLILLPRELKLFIKDSKGGIVLEFIMGADGSLQQTRSPLA